MPSPRNVRRNIQREVMRENCLHINLEAKHQIKDDMYINKLGRKDTAYYYFGVYVCKDCNLEINMYHGHMHEFQDEIYRRYRAFITDTDYIPIPR